ncbi:MAG: pirin family protein [Cellvibrionaceae bacterium]
MNYVRKSVDRGAVDLSWLKSRHTFSFGSYYDPRHMSFGHLRVINDDIIAPNGGFDTHKHKNMEIISYAIEGQLAHKDSMGHEYVMGSGDVQRMSAGAGVEHSEFNPSSKNNTRFLQIWIHPDKNDYPPSYEQQNFPYEKRKNQWCNIISGSGSHGALTINQDAELLCSLLEPSKLLNYPLSAGRILWVQINTGSILIDGIQYFEGDGIGIEGENDYVFEGVSTSDFIIFDLKK